MKKIISYVGILLLTGFSFFYTEKVTNIIKTKDPIMIKLNEIKDDSYISTIKPIINNDEYITGINGCELDIDKSYEKMKTIKEFKKELIVMKEINDEGDLNDKYIVGANKLQKNISIVFIVKDNINNKLLDFLQNKKIKANFFVDLDYLENNTAFIKIISENNNIYYLGNNNEYKDEYMIYANNLIDINTNNKSNYCILENKNKEILKLCSEYNMKTIKSDIIRDNILSNIKEKISNGSIITIQSNEIDKINTSINYILSKGYNIVSLDELLNQNNKCDK